MVSVHIKDNKVPVNVSQDKANVRINSVYFHPSDVTILEYGVSTLDEVREAINSNNLVYCKVDLYALRLIIIQPWNELRFVYAPLIRKVKEGTREEAIFSVAFDDWILTFDAKADRPPDEATSIEWSFSKFVAESEVFYAHYNITTVSALDEAREAGKLIYCNYNSTFNWDKVPMVNYDDGWYFFSGIGAYGEFIQLSCNNESGWHSNVFTMPSEYDDTPSALGTASAGSSHGQYALGDHVHPLPSPRDIGVVKIFKYDVAFSADIESAYQSGASVWVQYNDWFYPLVYRGSATIHYFAGYGEDNVRVIMCTQDTWDVGDGRIPGAAINNINLPHDLGTKSVGSSLRYARADHVHQMPSASDVGAIASPSSPSVGDFLVYTANGWAAQTLAEWQGGSY